MTGQPEPYVTPLVRKLAAQHGVALASITPTGKGGRIRAEDVRWTAAHRAGNPASVSPAVASSTGAPKRGDIVASYPMASATTDAALPPFTASGVDPRELLKLPAMMRPAAAAATDSATVLSMIQTTQASAAREGVVTSHDDVSWVSDVWPT